MIASLLPHCATVTGPGWHSGCIGSPVTRLPDASAADEVVLSEVNVEQARLTFEQKGDGNNLQSLLDAIEAASDSGASDEAGEEVSLVIRRFRLSESQVTVIHDTDAFQALSRAHRQSPCRQQRSRTR